MERDEFVAFGVRSGGLALLLERIARPYVSERHTAERCTGGWPDRGEPLDERVPEGEDVHALRPVLNLRFRVEEVCASYEIGVMVGT